MVDKGSHYCKVETGFWSQKLQIKVRTWRQDAGVNEIIWATRICNDLYICFMICCFIKPFQLFQCFMEVMLSASLCFVLGSERFILLNSLEKM